MIWVRKAAGIHSQSQVLEESSDSYAYSAIIQGHQRKVMVRLGKNRDITIPSGYWRCVNGDHYSVYLEVGEGMETVNGERRTVRGEKFIENGQLFIQVGENTYDATGRLVK